MLWESPREQSRGGSFKPSLTEGFFNSMFPHLQYPKMAQQLSSLLLTQPQQSWN